MPPKAFIDLYKLPEDERIKVIGHTVMTHKKIIGVCVDDEPGKPERYIRKLKEWFPGIVIMDQLKGPVKEVITIMVGPPNPENN